MPSSGLSDSDIKKIQKQVKDVRKFISDIEKMGGDVPPMLAKSLKYLEVALNTGKDIGDAAKEASAALKRYEKDLMNACKKVDEEYQMVCEAKIARQWQARSVKFTLDYRNKNSVTAKAIKKTVQRYTPKLICKHWDYCAKTEKKAAK